MSATTAGHLKAYGIEYLKPLPNGDPDLEYLIVDGRLVRVHQQGAAKKVEQELEAMSKSRGGLSTKIHPAVDALGNPIRLLLTAGQASE